MVPPMTMTSAVAMQVQYSLSRHQRNVLGNVETKKSTVRVGRHHLPGHTMIININDIIVIMIKRSGTIRMPPAPPS